MLFYVNAGNHIGLGHFFRSVSLANDLKKKGIEITFCSSRSQFWEKQLQQRFPFKHIWIEEQELNRYCDDHEIKLIYIDTLEDYVCFSFDKQKIKVVIFQNKTAIALNADIYITPNLSIDDGLLTGFHPRTKVFYGLKYVMLNKDVTKYSPKGFSKPKKLIGVTVGGSDPNNTLMSLYFTILNSNLPKEYEINFFIPIDYMFIDEIPDMKLHNLKFIPYNLQYVIEQDLIISAYGVSVFEYMYLGIPTLFFSHSKNNAKGAEDLANYTEPFVNLGDFKNIKPENIEYAVNEILHKREIEEHIKKLYMDLIDGNGVKRVATIILDSVSI